jgi:hypothetical protein
MTSDSEQSAVERDFIESWDNIQLFYRKYLRGEYWELLRRSILSLIAEMRTKGYDKQFRVGQSMETFILSRSRRHGLRPGQPILAIYMSEDGNLRADYYETDVISMSIEIDRAELVSELEELLQQLLQHPID